jgi:hypothetical protein
MAMRMRAVLAGAFVIAFAVTAVVVFARIGGPSTACYALGDGPAVDKVIDVYNRMPATSKGDTSQTAMDRSRVLGIGRNEKSRDSGKYLTEIWFNQDDHTVTVATLSQTCELNLRPGLAAESIRDAAYPTKPARY